MSGRLIIVSNRLPITVVDEDGRATVRRSVGGLATGLSGPHERSGGLWIGWPGQLGGLKPSQLAEVGCRLEELRAVPVELSAAEVEVFYNRIANGVLWPLVHDRLDQLPLHIRGWNVYEEVNQRFASAVVEHHRPGDLIWVHDYQLFRVPALVRQQLPDARIGFFLHVPFPNPEILLTLPTRRTLVEGMLGADLIGFHTRRYRGHFTAALRRVQGIEAAGSDEFQYEGRLVRHGVFPMGVDATGLAERASTRAVSAETVRLKAGPERMLLGIDRLDYSKGIVRRLLSLECLFEEHPEWRGRVRLVQIAVPTRSGLKPYRRIRKQVEQLVGRINGRFGTASWTPVHYVSKSLPEERLLALYRAADVMLVTPLRDGMNLVAKEFAASRIDEDGVLILSEFAGAADELTDALVVNPYDVDGVAATIHHALTMEGGERRRRMRALRAQVMAHDVHRWADRFLMTLGAS